jgi:prepilin peptidase CpaA
VDVTLLFGGLVLATAGAVMDVRSGRIPNWLTVGGLMSGLLLSFCLQRWSGLETAAGGALVSGGIFFVLFMIGGLGAGDVKLMAAVGAWVGMAHAFEVLLVTAISGGILAGCWVVVHKQIGSTMRNISELIRFHLATGLRPHPDLNLRSAPSIRLPYGPAIAIGTFYLMCQRFWG